MIMINFMKNVAQASLSENRSTAGSRFYAYYKTQESSRKYEIKFQKFLSMPQYLLKIMVL